MENIMQKFDCDNCESTTVLAASNAKLLNRVVELKNANVVLHHDVAHWKTKFNRLLEAVDETRLFRDQEMDTRNEELHRKHRALCLIADFVRNENLDSETVRQYVDSLLISTNI